MKRKRTMKRQWLAAMVVAAAFSFGAGQQAWAQDPVQQGIRTGSNTATVNGTAVTAGDIVSAGRGTTVTVTTTDRTGESTPKVAKVTVTKVTDIPMTEFAISGNEDLLLMNSSVGSTYTITPTPSYADLTGVTWSITSGSEIATINASTGELSATSIGTVTIQAQSNTDNTMVDTKEVTVRYPMLSDAVASATYYGRVVCNNGHLHTAKTTVPSGCTAVGVLGSVSSTGHGLILALRDATDQTWNTINGWTTVTYGGAQLKVLPNNSARGSLTSYTTIDNNTVSNWAVTTLAAYQTIFRNLGTTNTQDSDGPTYDAHVNAYITGAGGTAYDMTTIAAATSYWTTTPSSITVGSEATAYTYNSKCPWNNIMRGFTRKVRPVLGF